MYPTLYQINEGIGIHTYGIMIMMGLLAAFAYSSHRARQVGIDSDKLPVLRHVGCSYGDRCLSFVSFSVYRSICRIFCQPIYLF